MQRIVFGILAVFLLQIGFQIYVAVEKTNDDYARLTPLGNSIPNTAPEIASIDDPVSDPIRESAEIKVTRISSNLRPTTHRDLPLSPAIAVARRRDRVDSAATTADFRPVVIVIPPRPAATRTAEKNAVIKPSEAPRYVREKRSLPQKALAVVKKPYDWIKSAASKLL